MSIWSAISKPFRAIGGFFAALFKTEFAKFLDKNKEIFFKIVLEVAESQLSGDNTKRDAAVGLLKAYFKSRGQAAKDHFLNAGIENVIVLLKEQGKI